MKRSTLSLLTLGVIIFTKAANIYASSPIICTTPRKTKVILIKENSIALSTPEDLLHKRSLASITSVRTKIQGKGFSKILFSDGIKHTIHIENKDHFSEIDDYIVMRSPKGHEMIYPLSCSL